MSSNTNTTTPEREISLSDLNEISEDVLEGEVPDNVVSNRSSSDAGLTPASYDDLDLPPLRMGATRVEPRLYSSTSSLQIPPSLVNQLSSRGPTGPKRYSLDGSRSRSRSPSINKDGSSGTDGNSIGGMTNNATVGTATSSTSGGMGDASSSSSIEDIVDPDILYDKMGLLEVDLKEQQQHHSSRQLHEHKLQPVSERMSEETLEDVHAFSDLSITRPTSSVGGSTSVTGEVGSHVLEPLDELDEVAEEGDEDSLGEDPPPSGKVILTNMENLTIADVTQTPNMGDTAPDAPTVDAINTIFTQDSNT